MKRYRLAALISMFAAAVLVGCGTMLPDVKFVAPDHGGPIKSLSVVYELGQDKFFPSPEIRAVKEVPVREIVFAKTLKKIAPLNGIDLRGIYRGSSLSETQFGTSHILQIRSTTALRTIDMKTTRINLVIELYEASAVKPRVVWQAELANIISSIPVLARTPEQTLSDDISGLVEQILLGLDRSKFIQLPGGEMIDIDGKPYTGSSLLK